MANHTGIYHSGRRTHVLTKEDDGHLRQRHDQSDYVIAIIDKDDDDVLERRTRRQKETALVEQMLLGCAVVFCPLLSSNSTAGCCRWWLLLMAQVWSRSAAPSTSLADGANLIQFGPLFVYSFHYTDSETLHRHLRTNDKLAIVFGKEQRSQIFSLLYDRPTVLREEQNAYSSCKVANTLFLKVVVVFISCQRSCCLWTTRRAIKWAVLPLLSTVQCAFYFARVLLFVVVEFKSKLSNVLLQIDFPSSVIAPFQLPLTRASSNFNTFTCHFPPYPPPHRKSVEYGQLGGCSSNSELVQNIPSTNVVFYWYYVLFTQSTSFSELRHQCVIVCSLVQRKHWFTRKTLPSDWRKVAQIFSPL